MKAGENIYSTPANVSCRIVYKILKNSPKCHTGGNKIWRIRRIYICQSSKSRNHSESAVDCSLSLYP